VCVYVLERAKDKKEGKRERNVSVCFRERKRLKEGKRERNVCVCFRESERAK